MVFTVYTSRFYLSNFYMLFLSFISVKCYQRPTLSKKRRKMSEEVQTTDQIVEETTESGSKTFTQDEVNALIESRLARAKKQMPTREDLEAFKAWKDSQKSDVERNAQREQEYLQVLQDKENILRENNVLKSGVNYDDADYVLFKVSKMQGDFDDNLKTFLTDNPKYTAKAGLTLNTGVIATKTQPRDEDGVTAILRKKYPNLL